MSCDRNLVVDMDLLKFTGSLKHELILAKLKSGLGRSLYYKASSEPPSERTRVSSEFTPKNTSFVKLQSGSPNANPLPLIAQLALKFPKASPANVFAQRMLLEMK